MMMSLLTRADLLKRISARVVGQEKAVETVATAVYMHIAKTMLRKTLSAASSKETIKSSHVLITGPSGCGKTYMAETAAKETMLPYLEISARSLTQEGYKGNNISEVFYTWYGDLTEAEKKHAHQAVVFIDELDKICVDNRGNGWEVGIQHCLLKVVEGTTLLFTDKGSKSVPPIDTRGMLFIFGGNFQTIREDVRVKKSMGFSTSNSPVETKVANIHKELQQAGLIQELTGRISLVTEVHELTRDQLKRALMEAEGSIYKQYQLLYSKVFGKELQIEEFFIDRILDECIIKGTGARGLQSAMDSYIVEKVGEESISVNNFIDEQGSIY